MRGQLTPGLAHFFKCLRSVMLSKGKKKQQPAAGNSGDAAADSPAPDDGGAANETEVEDFRPLGLLERNLTVATSIAMAQVKDKINKYLRTRPQHTIRSRPLTLENT